MPPLLCCPSTQHPSLPSPMQRAQPPDELAPATLAAGAASGYRAACHSSPGIHSHQRSPVLLAELRAWRGGKLLLPLLTSLYCRGKAGLRMQ